MSQESSNPNPNFQEPEKLMLAGCKDHRGTLNLSCCKIRWRETGVPLKESEVWELICNLGNALRDVHDHCEPSTHHRFANDGLSAMQSASGILRKIGM